MTYTDIITRTDPGVDGLTGDSLVPEPWVAQVIQDLPGQSITMGMARRVTMSSRTQRQPVLSVLPQAYFVGGDTGMKQTSKQEWTNISLVAEEIAVIIPIPEAYLDDAGIPIWSEVRPRAVEALAAKIDGATIFGVDKPATWGTDLYSGIVAAGNVVTEGTGVDLAQDVALLGEGTAKQGGRLSGFAAAPGFEWRLVGLRSTDGTPIYQTNLAGPITRGLYGYPMMEPTLGEWDADEVVLIGGDWSKSIFGVRQDVTFKLFTESVVSDDAGNVILNLMQQDSVALRMVFRCGWAVANPVNRMATDEATRFPFHALQAAGASGPSS